ncbi:MAG: hypothetical protein Q9219_004918 [cf. Caloplaca sp. 3 TL-2023]
MPTAHNSPNGNQTSTAYTDAKGNTILLPTFVTNPSTKTVSPPPTASLPKSEDYYDPTSTDPFSPFYSHARASESRTRLQQPNMTDLEKGTGGIAIHTNQVKSTQSLPATDNKPSLLCRSEARKQRGLWRNMSPKKRLMVQILIAVLFIGFVTGLGVGVSKAMGTGIWKGEDRSSAGIGQS